MKNRLLRGIFALAVVLILAALMTKPFAKLIFAELSAARITAIYGYLVFVIVTFVIVIYPSILLSISNALKVHHDWIYQRIGRKVLNQTIGAWFLFALFALIFSVIIVDTILANNQSGNTAWVSITINSGTQSPPELSIKSAKGGRPIHFIWKPYPVTYLGIRPIDINSPILIQSINADSVPQNFSQIKVFGQSTETENGIEINGRSGVLLKWESPTRSIDLRFGPGQGTVELLWNDQAIRYQLISKSRTVNLSMGGYFNGWALLTSEQVDSIQIVSSNPQASFEINNISIWTKPPQIFENAKLVQLMSDRRNCPLITSNNLVKIVSSEMSCSIYLPRLSPLYRISWIAKVSLWIGISIAILLFLWISRTIILSIRSKRRKIHKPILSEQSIRTINSLPFNATFLNSAIILFCLTSLFQLIYTFVTPWIFTIDSYDYYKGAIEIIRTHNLFATGYRTPGYPLIISILKLIFGDSISWIVLTQHLLFALLAVISYWSLKDIIGKPGAWITGLIIGVAPLMSISASTVMTESTFSVLLAASFFLYIKRNQNIKLLLISGLLSGIATLIRPNGLIFIVVICIWELFKGWISSDLQHLGHSLLRTLILVVGCLLFILPWVIFVAALDHSLDISRGLSLVGSWTNEVAEGIITPDLEINRPDRAIWYFPEAWNNNPFEIYYSGFSPVAASWTEWAPTYYSQGIKEGIGLNKYHYLDVFKKSVLYNFSFRWSIDSKQGWTDILGGRGNGKYLYYPFLTYFANYFNKADLQLKPPIDELPYNNTSIPFQTLAYHWIPESPARNLATGFSSAAIRLWVWVSVFASVGLLLGVFSSANNDFVVGGFTWIASIFSYALAGYGADRYIGVFEPILYSLAAIFLLSTYQTIRNFFANRNLPLKQ